MVSKGEKLQDSVRVHTHFLSTRRRAHTDFDVITTFDFYVSVDSSGVPTAVGVEGGTP